MSIKSIIAKILIWAGAPLLTPAKRQIVKLDAIVKTRHGRNDFKATGYTAHVTSLGVGDEVVFLLKEKEHVSGMQNTLAQFGARTFGHYNCRVTADGNSRRVTIIRIA